MVLTTISGEIQTQPLNDNFSFLNEKINNYAIFNVQDEVYGAIGNGTTDDTTAIQSALDAATAAGGGIVFFPEGTYLITDTLTNGVQNIIICGVGLSSTIKQTIDTKHGINVGEHNGVVIRDLRILTSGYVVSAGNGIHSDMAGNLLIYNVVCQDFYNGFYIDTRTLVTQSQVYLVNCNAFSNQAIGFYINKGTDVVLSKCRGLSSGSHGAYIYECSGLIVDACLFLSNTGSGIMFDGVATNDWNFINHTISDGNTAKGYYLTNLKGLQISNSWAGTNNEEGFLFLTTADDVIVSNCQARNNGTHGIQVNGSTNITFNNCISVNNKRLGAGTGAGFAVTSSADKIKIIGCTAYKDLYTQDYGIQTGIGVTNSNISDNTVYGNDVAQMDIGSYAGNIIRNNHGFKTEASGFATVTAAIGSVAITHNLATTPTRVKLTPTSDTFAVRWWGSSKNSATFTISFNATITADVTFDWEAFVGEVDYA